MSEPPTHAVTEGEMSTWFHRWFDTEAMGMSKRFGKILFFVF